MGKIDTVIALLERIAVATERMSGVTEVKPLTEAQIQQRREAFAKRVTTEPYGKDAKTCGVHTELMNIDGNEILNNVSVSAQSSWIKAFGLELIRRELPTAAAKWNSDDERSEWGKLPLFLFHWFKNAKSRPQSNSTCLPVPGSTVAKSASVVSQAEAERTRRQIKQNDAVKPTKKMLEEIRRINRGEEHEGSL